MLEKTAAPLDIPRVVDGRADRSKDAQCGPEEDHGAGHTQPNARALHLIQLGGDEINAPRKVMEQQVHHGRAIRRVGGDAAKKREQQEQQWKEREERVVRDGRRERQVVTLSQAAKRHPGRAGRATGVPSHGAPQPTQRLLDPTGHTAGRRPGRVHLAA